MRAVVFEEFGGPEVLTVQDRPEPHAGPGQVRIRVRAAGVNPFDYKVRRGLTKAKLPAVPGFEVAGVVDEAGEGAEFAVGDEVVGWSKGGAYAEYALGGNLAHKPAGLSWEQAVSLPVAGETAQRVLDELGVKSGETILIHGGAGAVGSVAVQLAVAAGLTVVGTASNANHEYLRTLGAIPVAYGEGLVDRVRAAAPQGVDAVFDTAGKGGLKESIELRGSTDRIITIADYAAAAELGVQTSGGGSAPEQVRAGLDSQLQAAAHGTLITRIAGTFTLDDAGAAQALSESGHAHGKIVVVP
jgi:NADPH:quinone reductase-like Zn-dependent oxidoreductase